MYVKRTLEAPHQIYWVITQSDKVGVDSGMPPQLLPMIIELSMGYYTLIIDLIVTTDSQP